MATLVFFHAHPDDESLATAGTMALAADAGDRVVLVMGTRGELGEPQEGVLEHDEELAKRRSAETQESADILGVARVEFLGYRDSGMMGESTNDDPESFWQADVDVAASALAEILREENADLIVVYDDHGVYGHPDHIQVHRVGTAAARRAGCRVLESTFNRTAITRLIEEGAARDVAEADEAQAAIDGDTIGTPEEQITHELDVSAAIDRKRRSMEAHRSQIGPDSWFLTVPPPDFGRMFGAEWYIDPEAPRAVDEPLRTRLL